MAMGLGKFFKKIIHNIGRIFGIVSSSADKRMRKSLLTEQARVDDIKNNSESEFKKEKEQLISLKRSINKGRKSLISAWYDNGIPEQTIGS